RGEVFWGLRTDGSIEFVGSNATDLQRSRTFPAEVRSLVESGGIRDVVAGGTTHRLGVLPLHVGDDRAAFVVTIDPAAERAELRDLMVTYLLLAAFSLLVIVAVATWTAGRLLEPLRRLRRTAQTIGANSLDERLEVTGHDDLTELQRTFNAMLDRI